MNERVMQFRIGMFVIVAGLVLTMLIVWFGESPALFQNQVYLRARFREAPGVSEGIPVRKSGIRIGEVRLVEFDERPNQPDAVLVTLAIESKYRLKEGSIPKISRSLIGDVAIDMSPGTGQELLPTSNRAETAPILDGEVAPDPSKALAAASSAFEKAGGTLQAIEDAAKGLSAISKKADGLDEFLATWKQTGSDISSAAKGIDGFIKANEGDFRPVVANLRDISTKLNKTLDDKTTADFKLAVDRIATAAAKLDTGLADLRPLLTDLGAGVGTAPVTNFGQTVYRLNRIASDVGMLTRQLSDGRGNLNPNGSVQKMFTTSELYDNYNRLALSANELLAGARPVLQSFRTFAEKVAQDPSALTRGALQR